MATQKSSTKKVSAKSNTGNGLDTYINTNDARELVNNFLQKQNGLSKQKKAKSSPCFIGLYDLHQLMKVPNFEGINIHQGLNNKGEEVFIFVPLTKLGKKLVEVQTFSIDINNSGECSNTYIAYMAVKRPCPPPPPGYTECPSSML